MIRKIKNPPSCPFCKRILGAFLSPGKAQIPSPGDASICIHCGEFLEFNEEMKLIEMSAQTLVGISGPAILEAKRTVQKFLALRQLKDEKL